MESFRVLVTDDNVDAALSLALLIGMMDGYEVRTVHDGAAAVSAAEEWRPHAALLDLDMPVVDGFGACAAIRRSLPDCLMVALSGHDEPSWRLRASDEGFDQYHLKGIHFRNLRLALQAGLARQRSSRARPASGQTDGRLRNWLQRWSASGAVDAATPEARRRSEALPI